MSSLKHLAIIMDGNGRWAKARGHSRFFGHVRGAKVARKIIEACACRGIPFLTLYTFSAENWQRPAKEVNFLMRLLKKQLLRELETLMKNNIRFQVIGDISRLPEEVLSVVNEVIRATENNSGMVLTFALSYGARQEITAAVQKMALAVKQGQLNVGDIDQDMVSSFLESSHLPDPDLILRTSGESRLSNFFLWQAAYSELFVTDTLWPDFNEAELDQALEAFTKRERRFGRILDENHAPAG